MYKRFVFMGAIVCAALLAACTVPDDYLEKKLEARLNQKSEYAPTPEQIKNADYGSYPANYKEAIKDYFNTYLKDPSSAIYGEMTKPFKEHVIKDLKPLYGYAVCANVNAKNSFGGYAGMETTWFFFRDGKILRIEDTELPIYIGRKKVCHAR